MTTESNDFSKAKKRKNLALLAVLIVLMLLMYAITMMQIKAGNA